MVAYPPPGYVRGTIVSPLWVVQYCMLEMQSLAGDVLGPAADIQGPPPAPDSQMASHGTMAPDERMPSWHQSELLAAREKVCFFLVCLLCCVWFSCPKELSGVSNVPLWQLRHSYHLVALEVK